MKLRLEIRQYHIDNGLRGRCQYCPVAMAMMVHGERPCVSHAELSILIEGNFYKAATPEGVKKFISDFDGFQPVKPCEFDVEFIRCA